MVMRRNTGSMQDQLPPRIRMFPEYTYKTNVEVRLGVDLAISKRDTAIVPAALYENKKGPYDIYILPKIINKRLSFPETVETCKIINESYRKNRRMERTCVYN